MIFPRKREFILLISFSAEAEQRKYPTFVPESKREGMSQGEIKLGLKENWKQFVLLVVVNAFVGGMIGMERTIFPQFAEEEFGIASKTAILSFIVAFGVSKAIANYYTGKLANRFGRKNLLLFGWILALPIPFMLLSASSWLGRTLTMANSDATKNALSSRKKAIPAR